MPSKFKIKADPNVLLKLFSGDKQTRVEEFLRIKSQRESHANVCLQEMLQVAG